MVAQRGIRLDRQGSLTTHHPNAFADPRVLADADLVIVLTKTYDTEAAARLIVENARRDALVLSVQNGVGSLDILQDICGDGRVIGGTTSIGCRKLDDQSVEVAHLGRVVVGELADHDNVRCIDVTDRIGRAGFDAEVSDDVRSDIWTKLAFSVAQNALSALTNRSFGELRKEASALEIARSLLSEIQLVAAAEGVTLRTEPFERLKHNWEKMPAFRPSMWQDVRSGRRTEIDAINGAIVRLAGHHGIAAPANELMTRLVKVAEAAGDT